MSIAVANAPRSEITIAGLALSVPAPFVEGHVLRSNEASVLNQTYAENIRNNFASAVRAAQEEAKKNGQTFDPSSLQAKLDEYINSYDFGIRKGGGAHVVLDPVEREARKLAQDRVKAALKKKGINLKDVAKEKLEELVTGVLEKYPVLREQAQRVVALKREIGQETMDVTATV